MVFGPLARPEDRTVTPPPDAPPKGIRRLAGSSEEPPTPPQPLHPKVPRLRPAASSTRRWSRRPPRSIRAVLRPCVQIPVSRAPPFVRCLIPEGTCPSEILLLTTAGLLGAARIPEGMLRSAPPAPLPGPRATPRALPEGSSRGAGEPRRVRRGFRLPQGNPWGSAQARQTLHPCGRRDGTRSPHGPEGRVPTWIRRVRGRAA